MISYRSGYALILLGVFLLLSSELYRRCQEPPPPTTDASVSVAGGELPYLLQLPAEYDAAGDNWPLILYLHGASVRGRDPRMVKQYGPPRWAEVASGFPFIVLSPQCPPDGDWDDPAALAALLDDVCAAYRVDEERLYLTGMSLGGGGVWRLAAAYPQRFAAVAPLCGFADPRDAARLAPVPIRVYHGARDRKVPISQSREMVEAIRRAGGAASLVTLSDEGHNIVNSVYYQDALYDWFLEHRR